MRNFVPKMKGVNKVKWQNWHRNTIPTPSKENKRITRKQAQKRRQTTAINVLNTVFRRFPLLPRLTTSFYSLKCSQIQPRGTVTQLNPWFSSQWNDTSKGRTFSNEDVFHLPFLSFKSLQWACLSPSWTKITLSTPQTTTVMSFSQEYKALLGFRLLSTLQQLLLSLILLCLTYKQNGPLKPNNG